MEETIRVEIDFIPYLCESFSTNEKLYKDIDLYYNNNKAYYYSLAKDNKYYNHPIALERTFQGTEYFRKSLGLILSENFENENIEELIKKGWKYIYTYVNNKTSFTVDDFFKSYTRKYHGIENISEDEFNSNFMILLWYTMTMHKDKLNPSQFLDKCWQNLYERLKHYEGEGQYFRLSLDQLSKEKNDMINELIVKLKNNGFSYGRRYDDDSYDFSDNVLEYKMKLELLYDFYNISLPSLYPSTSFKEKDLKEILVCYTVNKNDIDNIDMEDLTRYILSAINIKGLTSAYTKAKQYYLSNNKDTYEVEVEQLKDILHDNNIRTQYIKEENKKLLDMISRKDKTIKLLENKLNKIESNNDEVDALREFIFSLENDKFNESDNVVNIDNINKCNGLIVGGFDSLQIELKTELSNWKFVSAKALNFDKNLLNDRELVVFMVNYMNHGLYYKTIEGIKRLNKSGNNIKIGYINNNNYELILQELNKIIER